MWENKHGLASFPLGRSVTAPGDAQSPPHSWSETPGSLWQQWEAAKHDALHPLPSQLPAPPDQNYI